MRTVALTTCLLTTAAAAQSSAHAAELPAPTANYTLRASLDPTKHIIRGEGTLTLTNRTCGELRHLWLHLYMNAFKNERTVFLRAPRSGSRGQTLPNPWGTIDIESFVQAGIELRSSIEFHAADPEDETDVRIPLTTPIPVGATESFVVRWTTQLPSIVERTGFDGSFHLAGQWFPKFAKLRVSSDAQNCADERFDHFPFDHLSEFYADFGTYDVSIDVPPSFVVAATGEQLSKTEAQGRLSFHFHQENVHDFAFTAWDKFFEKSTTIAGVKVRFLYPKDHEAVVSRQLDALSFAIPHMNRRYGDYPYRILTVVHPPDSAGEAGGMEYPTLITTGGNWATPAFAFTPEHLVIHEYGHQYFYGLVASNEHAWPFLDEGFNSFAEIDTLSSWKGQGSIGSLWGLRVGIHALHAVAAREGAHDEVVAKASSEFAQGRNYGTLVYSRTATILETFKRVYGDDPFTSMFASYVRDFRYLNPTPPDWLKRCDTLGPSAAANMQRALFDKGWVDYAITGLLSTPRHTNSGLFEREGKRETVARARGTGFENQAWVVRRGNLNFPVDLRFDFEDGSNEVVRWEGRSPTVVTQTTSKAVSVCVDPDHRVLLDQSFANNCRGADKPARKTFSLASLVIEVLTSWVLP